MYFAKAVDGVATTTLCLVHRRGAGPSPLFELFSNPTISLDRSKMRDLRLVRYDPFSEVTAVVRGEDGTLLLQFTHARSRLLPEPR